MIAHSATELLTFTDLLRRGPLTVGQVAAALGVPGPWTIRRLEKRGVLPEPPRSLVHGDRLYSTAQVAEMRRSLQRLRERAA